MSNNDDISIEEELLKVTSSSGDNNNKRSSKKKSSKKRKSKKYSSSSESEEGQLSHSDVDESKHRKPLKKRKVGEGGYSSNEERGEYGVDLVGDEEDRKYLNSLTELERERIIAERFQKRKEQQEYEELKKSISKSKSSPSQSQPRQSKRVQSKHDALSDLRKKMQRAKAGSKHSSSSSSESESSFSESEDDYRRDKKDKKKSRDRSSRSKDESEDEFEIKEDQERLSPEDEKLTLEDVNAICLKRTFLEQKCEEHYFDKMVEGFFVRVGMTSTSEKRVYLLTQVVQVKELPKKYTLGSKKTNKYLILGIGSSTKQFSMDVVSNSPVDEEEFSRWCKQMEKFKLAIITKQQAQEKIKELHQFKNYVYTEQDVKTMIENRKKARNLPMNLSAERARLLNLKVAAQESGNQQEAESASKELELLEQKIKKQEEKARKTPDKATLINQKNRELELDKSAMIDHSHSWITDPDLDPFSRRQTKSFNSFIRKEDKENVKEQSAQKEVAQLQQVENKQPKKAKSSLLLKADFQDPETALKNAHDFDLDQLHISTPVKPITISVEENNQKTTKKTLSVEDYKRRRGLV